MLLNLHSHNIKAAEIPGKYQYIALNKGPAMQRQWHRNRHNLLKFLNFFSPDFTVLDAGCGSGNVVLEFAEYTSSFIGVDNNKACIDFLNKMIIKRKIKKAKGVTMDLLKIKFENKFDRIIMTEVLEHFSEKDGKKILSSLRKVLNPDGKILITTPNYKSLWALLEPLIDIFHLSPKLWGDQHLIKFTPEKLNKILTDSGFNVEKKGTLNFISPVLGIFNRRLADKLAYFEFKYISFGNLLYTVAVLN